MSFIALYLRSVRESFRRSNDLELAGVWKFSMASVALIVFALLSISNAVVGEDAVPSVLAAAACVGLSAVNGAYVVHAVRRASGDNCG